MDDFTAFAEHLLGVAEQVTGQPRPVIVTVLVVLALVFIWIVRKVLFGTTASSIEKNVPRFTKGDAALSGYRDLLERHGVTGAEQDRLAHAYIEQLDSLQARIDEIEADDPALAQQMNAARVGLDSGQPQTAIDDLKNTAELEGRAGQELRRSAEQRLKNATFAHVVAGDLEQAACRAEVAMEQYGLAIAVVPSGSDILLAECLNKHGMAAYGAGKINEATMSIKRALRVMERIKGLNSPDVASVLNNLAMLHYTRGDLAAAEPLYRRALAIDEETAGETSAAVATDLNNLALLLNKSKRFEEAEPLFKRALAIKEQVFEVGHPSLVTGQQNYAALLRVLGHVVEAEALEAASQRS